MLRVNGLNCEIIYNIILIIYADMLKWTNQVPSGKVRGGFTEMSIESKDVEHVAKLARLTLTNEELDVFTEQLNAILQYAEKLNELDTEGVEPTTHVLRLSNVMRDDVVQESLTQEQVFRNAPEEEDGQFKVPAVLE
ncbi:Aspartyl/glutamyl-tRNA(Asn/Gln) amidotransferase subunit C [compost metagenome]